MERQPEQDILLAKNDFSKALLRELADLSTFRVQFYSRFYMLMSIVGFSLFFGLFYRPLMWAGIAAAAVLLYQYQQLKNTSQSLKISRKLSASRVAKGEEVEVSYLLWNRSKSSCPPLLIRDHTMYLRGDRKTLATRKNISGGRKALLTFEAKCIAPAGPLLMGVYKVEVEDDLGLFKFVTTYKDELTLQVGHGQLLNHSDALRRPKVSTFAGDMEVARSGHGLSLLGVREYRDGDPLNRICWKKSTVNNEFLVKEFESDVSRRVAFLISNESAMQIGYAASSTLELSRLIAIRLMRGYLEANSMVSLISSEVQLKDVSGVENLMLFERAVESLELRETDADGYAMGPKLRAKNELELLSYHLTPPSLIYFVVPYSAELELNWIRNLIKLKEDGFEPMVALVNPMASADQVRARFGDFNELAVRTEFDGFAVAERFRRAGIGVLWLEAQTLSGELGVVRYGEA